MIVQANISLSISIVCFDSRQEELQALFESLFTAIQQLRDSLNAAQIQIYLIDNSIEGNLSGDKFSSLQAQANTWNVELALMHGHGNVGYGAAHNLVIHETDCDYHLLLNPDLSVDNNCLLAGITFLAENENIVMASPYAEYASGEKQYLCKRYPSVFTFFVRGFFPNFLKKLFTKRLAGYEMHELSENRSAIGVPIASGCFMLCRTSALKQLGGFDEKFFLYFEDFDLCLRLTTQGKIAYVPAMRIRHTGGNAAGKGFSHIKMFLRSGIQFFNTHGWRFFRQTS